MAFGKLFKGRGGNRTEQWKKRRKKGERQIGKNGRKIEVSGHKQQIGSKLKKNLAWEV